MIPTTVRAVARASRARTIAFASPIAAATGTRLIATNAFTAQTNSRAAVAVAMALGAGAVTVSMAETKTDYAMVKEALAELIETNDCGPLLVRLAWHAAGTYDVKSKTGGSNGATMRFPPESCHGANAGLNLARQLLEPIKAKFPGISYADLWTLAGSTAIEVMGGPEIKWRPGRSDAADGTACPEDGRLPDADGRDTSPAQHVRDIFYRQGFNDAEIVALLGAHALGRCHPDRSGFDGPWTRAETTFSNEFFRVLLEEKWTPKQWSGPGQMENAAKDLMMLPTDMCLIEDAAFRAHVERFCKDEEVFFKEFSKAFTKMMENGVKFPRTGLWAWCPW